MKHNSFPEWINKSIDEIRNDLQGSSKYHFVEFVNKHNSLSQRLDELQEESRIIQITNLDRDFHQKRFGNAYAGLALCVESYLSQFAYTNFYKMKSWNRGLCDALEDGNFLLAASCCRGLFEQICHFNLFLGKLENLAIKTSKLLESENKNLRKGKTPPEKWHQSYVELQIETINCSLKSIRGSDFDWKNRMDEFTKNTHRSEIKEDGSDRHGDRKTHINSCIESVEKEYKIQIAEHYSLLSDMVHPNFGSNSLVTVTCEFIEKDIYFVVLSCAPRNLESAKWFFELVPEAMYQIIYIGNESINRANKLVSFFQERTSSFGLPMNIVPRGNLH